MKKLKTKISDEDLLSVAISEARKISENNSKSPSTRGAAAAYCAWLKTINKHEIKILIEGRTLLFVDSTRPSRDTLPFDTNRSENSIDTATARHAASVCETLAALTSSKAISLAAAIGIGQDRADSLLEALAGLGMISGGKEASAVAGLIAWGCRQKNGNAAVAALAIWWGAALGFDSLSDACKKIGCSIVAAQSALDDLSASVPSFVPTPAVARQHVVLTIVKCGHSFAEAEEIVEYLESEKLLASGREIEGLRLLVAKLLSGRASLQVRARALANHSGISARLGGLSPAAEARKLGVSRQQLNKVQMIYSNQTGPLSLQYRRAESARAVCKKAQEEHWRNKKPSLALKLPKKLICTLG